MATVRPALVLLVDDNPSSLKLLSEALADQPLSLAVAVDGEMALRQVQLMTSLSDATSRVRGQRPKAEDRGGAATPTAPRRSSRARSWAASEVR